MSEAFNPYRQWLGVSDGRRPGNHYELLGIPLCEADPAVITGAVDALTARVRAIRPGPHMSQWQQLLGSLAEAKRCLLDPATKATYDAALRGEPVPGQPAPPPSKKFIPLSPAVQSPTNTPKRPSSPLVAKPIGPSAPSDPATRASRPVEPVADVDDATPSGVEEEGFPNGIGGADRHRHTRRRAGPSAAQLGVYALTAVFFGAAVVLGYLVYQRRQDSTTSVPPGPQTGSPSSPSPGGLAQGPPAEERPGGRTGTTPANDPTPDPDGPSPQPEKRPGPEMPPGEERTGAPGETPPQEKTPLPEASKQPSPTVDPDSPAEQQRREAVARALADARSAMAEHDLEAARGHLRTAAEKLTTPEEKAEAGRLDTLLGHLHEFWRGIGRAVAGLRATEELQVGDTFVVVVEASSEELTIKVAGQIRTYPVAEMPFRLVDALADARLGRDPATRALVGTYNLVDPKGDPYRAEQLWEEASRGGIDLDDLMPELTRWEKSPTGSGGAGTKTRAPLGAMRGEEPPTDAEELKRIEEEVKATFREEYDAATSLPGKSQLAAALLEAGEATSDDAAVRFVLLREARDTAVAAGEGELACRAIDAMSASHKTDVLQMKRTALADAAKKARGLDGQKQIAETALDLVQEAVVAERFDEAKELAEVALSAARKMNSRPLIQKALLAVQRIEALQKRDR